MFSIRREQGRLGELAPLIRMLASSDRSDAWRPGLTAMLAELGMGDGRAARAGRASARTGSTSSEASLWLASLSYLTDSCAALGDSELAADVYSELLPSAGRNVMIGHLVLCYGAADRYLGMLSTVLGEWADAEAHFEAALGAQRSARCADLVRAHRVRVRAHAAGPPGFGRPIASRGARGKTISIAETGGLASLAARASQLSPSAAATKAFPDDLSPREVAILRLVARGLSNREIGSELTISEHTAANHVRSILRKTQSANRTEATAYAHRRGLVQ